MHASTRFAHAGSRKTSHPAARDSACAKYERTGALALEAALVYPVLLLLILGLIIGGMGVFRYQQVHCQAREAARFASVRGSDWQKDADLDSPTKDEICTQAVVPLAAGMDTSKISIQIQWIDQTTGKAVDWDSASKNPRSLTASNDYVTNTVRVTITYQWSPNLYFGTLTLTSTCEVPMTF
jgi:Flp pilus assembly protein TadG